MACSECLDERSLKDSVLNISKMETVKCTRCHSKKNKKLKSLGLIDQGNLGTIASNAELRGKNTRKRKSLIKKTEVDEVFDHVWQWLMNDLFLENYGAHPSAQPPDTSLPRWTQAQWPRDCTLS